MRTVLFQNFKKKMSEAAIGRCLPEIDALLTPFWILTINQWTVLKLFVNFQKIKRNSVLESCCSSAQKSIPSEENFNGHAKIPITHILYRRTKPRGVFRTHSHIYDGAFLQKEAVSNFFKTFSPQMLDWVLNTPLSSEKLRQECEHMTNSPSLMI